jgi:hypothetical protein
VMVMVVAMVSRLVIICRTLPRKGGSLARTAGLNKVLRVVARGWVGGKKLEGVVRHAWKLPREPAQ